MSKLSQAKTDLVFLKKYSEYMKENEWKYADYEIKAFERLIKYCDVYIKLLKIKDKIVIRYR